MEEKINKYLTEIKHNVDTTIDRLLLNDNPLIDALYKSASYSASGGKRVRAVFMYLVGQLFDVSDEKLLIPSCAVELLHAASLVMDDLPYMDDSQLRRGKPANHVVFGQDVALLASIGLISRATEIILEDKSITADQRLKVSQVMARSYGLDGLAAGQFVDLKLKRKDVDFEIIEFINRKKTATLFLAAGQVGALLGDANSEQMAAIKNFAEDIGFAFQIIDDMLDIAGDEKIVGKNLKHDKLNFVKLVGREEAENYLKEYHRKAEESLVVFGKKADQLKTFSSYLIKRTY